MNIIKNIYKYIEQKTPFTQYCEQQKNIDTTNKKEITQFRQLLFTLIDVLCKIQKFKSSKSILVYDSNVHALYYFINNCSDDELRALAKDLFFQIFIKFNVPFDTKTGNATIDALLQYIESYKDNFGNPLFTQFLTHSKAEIKKIINKYIQ